MPKHEGCLRCSKKECLFNNLSVATEEVARKSSKVSFGCNDLKLKEEKDGKTKR